MWVDSYTDCKFVAAAAAVSVSSSSSSSGAAVVDEEISRTAAAIFLFLNWLRKSNGFKSQP